MGVFIHFSTPELPPSFPCSADSQFSLYSGYIPASGLSGRPQRIVQKRFSKALLSGSHSAITLAFIVLHREIAVFAIISSIILPNVAGRPVYHTFTARFNDYAVFSAAGAYSQSLPKTDQMNRCCRRRSFDNGLLVQ
jgi:hypothetical protein